MTKTPCEMWRDLIYAKIAYEGQFYDEFVKEKAVLTSHLNGCPKCKSRLLGLIPSNKVNDLKNMSDDDFLAVITGLRNKATTRKQRSKSP